MGGSIDILTARTINVVQKFGTPQIKLLKGGREIKIIELKSGLGIA